MQILSKVGLQIRPSGLQFARHYAPPLGRMMYRRSVGFAIRPPSISGFIIREKILNALKMLILRVVGLQIRPSGQRNLTIIFHKITKSQNHK